MTDEQIFDIAEPFGAFQYGDAQGHKRIGFARAIEAAATAPLLSEIEKLREEKADIARLCKELEAKLAQRVPDVDALTDKIASLLGLTYHCTRVWDAWNVGTMSQDDFEPVDESETPREIAEEIHAMLAAAPAAPEQQDQSEQHLGMVECRHCGGTGDAPYMTTSPVPYQRIEKCATCDGAGIVTQAPNAQQAEHVPETNFGNIQKAEAQEPCAWANRIDWAYHQSEQVTKITRYQQKQYGFTTPLFTRPQPAQRPPLTIAEVEAIIARWSYELHGDRARFIVRETELAHGIG